MSVDGLGWGLFVERRKVLHACHSEIHVSASTGRKFDLKGTRWAENKWLTFKLFAFGFDADVSMTRQS